ncbi:MAG: group 1 truncated hemoglobin [Bdellovibrionota bacterium]
MSSLYEEIGPKKIEKIVAEFYDRAFNDVLIGHFFFGKDKENLIKIQTSFVSPLLGAKNIKYIGRPLKTAHHDLKMKLVHFDRRQVLLGEVLQDFGLTEKQKDKWLFLEDSFRSMLFNDSFGGCRD